MMGSSWCQSVDVVFEPRESWLIIQLVLGAQFGDKILTPGYWDSKAGQPLSHGCRSGMGQRPKDLKHCSAKIFIIYIKVLGAIIEEHFRCIALKGGQVLKQYGK